MRIRYASVLMLALVSLVCATASAQYLNAPSEAARVSGLFAMRVTLGQKEDRTSMGSSQDWGGLARQTGDETRRSGGSFESRRLMGMPELLSMYKARYNFFA